MLRKLGLGLATNCTKFFSQRRRTIYNNAYHLFQIQRNFSSSGSNSDLDGLTAQELRKLVVGMVT